MPRTTDDKIRDYVLKKQQQREKAKELRSRRQNEDTSYNDNPPPRFGGPSFANQNRIVGDPFSNSNRSNENSDHWNLRTNNTLHNDFNSLTTKPNSASQFGATWDASGRSSGGFNNNNSNAQQTPNTNQHARRSMQTHKTLSSNNSNHSPPTNLPNDIVKKAELDDVIRLVQNLEGQLQNLQFQLDSVKMENVRLREKVDKLETQQINHSNINSNSGVSSSNHGGNNRFSNQSVNINNNGNRNNKRKMSNENGFNQGYMNSSSSNEQTNPNTNTTQNSMSFNSMSRSQQPNQHQSPQMSGNSGMSGGGGMGQTGGMGGIGISNGGSSNEQSETSVSNNKNSHRRSLEASNARKKQRLMSKQMAGVGGGMQNNNNNNSSNVNTNQMQQQQQQSQMSQNNNNFNPSFNDSNDNNNNNVMSMDIDLSGFKNNNNNNSNQKNQSFQNKFLQRQPGQQTPQTQQQQQSQNMGGFGNSGSMGGSGFPGNDSQFNSNDNNHGNEGSDMPSLAEVGLPDLPPEAFEDAGPRVECSQCGRKFLETALAKHTKICNKVFMKKRKPVDMASQRLPEEALKLANEKAMEMNPRGNKRSAAAEAAAAKKAKWKNDSLRLREAIRAGRMVKEAIASGKDLKDIPVAQSQVADDRVPCPHCGRKFAADTADRHIPKCKNVKSRPKPLLRKK